MPLPRFSSLLGAQKVVPVLTIESVDDAVPLANALAAGGLRVIEVTLRTEAAMEACLAIARQCPDVVLGVGTVLSVQQVDDAINVGAKFLVTPGTTHGIAERLLARRVPALPGAATVSEMLALAQLGFKELKFFPAEAAGGVDYLKSVSGPMGDLRFCPTGGIGPANAKSYISLPNVLCVGGSWVTPKSALAARDWSAITRLAVEAGQL